MNRELEYNISLLDKCLDRNILDRYINGQAGNFGVMQQNYVCEMNPYACLKAIHEKYKSDPNSDIDKKFHDAILNNFQKLNNKTPFLQNVLEVLIYQLICEKRKIAPFEIEKIDLLNEFKENLIRNKEYYSSLESSLDGGTTSYYDFVINRNETETKMNDIKIL